MRTKKPKLPNIIFLDIDGVLCTVRSNFAYGDKGGLTQAWDITACQMLRRICIFGDFKLVISSTWRNSPDVWTYLVTYGLGDHVYDGYSKEATRDPKKWKTPNLNTGLRGDEIKKWMEDNFVPPLYVIIDDANDFLEEQKKFHVHTDNMEGFMFKDFQKINDLYKEKYGGDEELWQRIQKSPHH